VIQGERIEAILRQLNDDSVTGESTVPGEPNA
jgi:hypothetical protein